MEHTRSILFLLSLWLCNSLAAQFDNAEEVYRTDMMGPGTGAVLLPNPAGGDDVLILDGYKLLLYRNGSAPGIPVEDCLNSLRVISVTVGDIDGDGFEDIVVFHVSPSQNLLPKEITWYRNLGDATFSTGTILLSGDFPNPRIAIHDVDGNGSKDIVVGLSESGGNPGSISWFPQLSDGTFGQKEVLLEDIGYRFAIADLDGDGDLDMVVAAYGNPQSTLRTLYRENDGSYTIESERMVGGSVIGLWLKDLDLDGTLDLYLGGGGLRMMRNDENGGWEDPEVIIPSTTKQGFADVNGDGLLDVWGLVGGADESKALKYRLADSTGGLQETMSRYMGWLSFSPVWTDLTGDGINDLVYGSDVSFYEVGYFPGDSIGGYDEYRRMTRSMRDVGQMLVLDIDGDGDKDIIVLSKQDYKVSWLEEQGNGNWLEHVMWQSNVHLQYGGPVNDEVPLELVAMDADGNGTMDLLMVRANTPPEGAPSAIFHGTKWLLNDGNGVFTYSTSLQGYPTAQGSFWARPKAMDFDQDGVLDILAFRDHIWFWRGVAGGGFEAPVILDAGGGQSFLLFDGMMGDVDGDGDLDIVAPGGYPPTYHERMTFMECTGPAVFSELQDITEGQGFTGTMQFWDIDEDGDLDVYASRKYGAESVWLENIGGDF